MFRAMKKSLLTLLTTASLMLSQTVLAHDGAPAPMSLDELLKAFGWSFDTAEIKSEKHGEHFYVLFGIGGNIGVSIGEQGVFIVDDQFPEMIPKVQAKIKELGGGDIDFAVNTHWHFDHADGNKALGKEGVWLVSQSNSRKMMQDSHLINLVALAYQQEPYPAEALPIITYDDRMQFHFNGEQIDLLHFGPAHTTGDTAVIFRGQNIVHMGDVFNNNGYPFIDAGNGGELAGMIQFCESVLAELNENTVVVPGHGPVTGYAEFAAYIEMLKTMKTRLEKLIADGADLEAIIAAKPSQDFDEKYGDSSGFLNRSYHSLIKK